jgi:NADH-quinone oxidoreductase subunit L
LVPIGAVLASLLTAFYVTRLIVKLFFGEFRLGKSHPHIKVHMSEGGWQYKLPLVLLAVCCLFPLFSINPFYYEKAWLMSGFHVGDYLERLNIYHSIIPIGANILNVLVIYLAYAMYVKRGDFSFPQKGFLFRMSYNEWYIDRIYAEVIVKPVLALSRAAYWFDKKVIDGFIRLLTKLVIVLSKLAAWTDRIIIDGFLHLLAAIVQGIGNFARNFQSGKVQYYIFSMLAALLALFILKMFI